MIRNLKAFGLAVVAVFAMSAVAVSAAQAAEFHSEATNTTLTAKAEGNHVFDAAGRTITCEEANFEGKIAGSTTASEVTFTPQGQGYGKCQFGFVGVSVAMNNCDYVFHSNNTVDIAGTSCTGITFEANFFGIKCHVRVTKQNGLSTATYKNIGTGSAREITLEPAVNSIQYTAQGGGCTKQGQFSDGQYTSGNTKVTGEETGTQTMKGIEWK